MKTPNLALGLVVLLASLALSGCVSPKYKPADKGTPPPLPLNLTAAQPPVEATVNTVIVYRGPGSWKREAYWDEYVVSIANRGAAPLVVESAALTDFRGAATAPGDNPWLLEKQSLSRQDELNRTAKTVLIHLGGTWAAAEVSALTFLVGGIAGGTAGAVAGAALFPAYIGGTIYKNISRRHDIEAEFAHRRLVLPGTVAPGQTAQGSLFFRISPGPQRLVLRGRAGDEPVEVAIDLAPLKDLHLVQPQPAATPPQSAPLPPAPAVRTSRGSMTGIRTTD